jgi:diamine N-acetyltransferase
MNISVATTSELDIIKDLAHAIWPSAYGAILSQAQLAYMLDKLYSIEALKEQLLEKNQVFLLLEEEGEYLGFCAYELNCDSSGNTKLHKLYVLPNTQGKGLGKLLLNEVEKIALAHANKGVFLNVNRFNKAQEFYLAMGYTIIKTEDIDIGSGYLMEDYIMQKLFK